jgi:hypothetical protein
MAPRDARARGAVSSRARDCTEHGAEYMEAIDWNRELRKIEREYDGLPPEPSASVAKARKAAEQRARDEAERKRARLGVSLRLGLVLSLLVALWWWPYATACGVELVAFVGAESMIAIGGLWTAVYAWRHRIGFGHTIALVLLMTGMTLVAMQVLPRTGYVTIVGVETTRWACARR